MNGVTAEELVTQRLADPPMYRRAGGWLHYCTSCGNVVGDTIQHNAFHKLIRGLVIASPIPTPGGEA